MSFIRYSDLFVEIFFYTSMYLMISIKSEAVGDKSWQNLQWWRYQAVKRNYDNMIVHFHTTLKCDRWTDRQTDILRQHSACYVYESPVKSFKCNILFHTQWRHQRC